MKTGSEEKGGRPLQRGPGLIEFRDVHFGYTPEREVLSELSIKLRPGKVTAIVGALGAGKSLVGARFRLGR